MDFPWLVTLPSVACHILANVTPYYKWFTLCLPNLILRWALRTHSCIFLHDFCSCHLHAFKQNSARYSHHLALTLGNCYGGFLQLNLLVRIGWKLGLLNDYWYVYILSWTLIYSVFLRRNVSIQSPNLGFGFRWQILHWQLRKCHCY